MTKLETKEDKRIYTLSQEKPVKAVIKMGLPLVAGMFVMVLYNLVDTFFIGLMHDDYQLAAVNLAYPAMMIMIALANMVGTGAASLIARSMGQQDIQKANHTLSVGIMLTTALSLLLSVTGFIFLDKIVVGLGAKENTYIYTKQYVEVLLAGSLLTMGNYTTGQLLRSEGSVKYSVIGMMVGTLANIILDPIFIFSFGMEIRGAAIATVLGNGIGMVCSLMFYWGHKTILSPTVKNMLPTAEILGEIFWVGVPATLETLLTSVAFIVNNNLAIGYGELTVAAMGIAQKIMSVGSYVYQGFAAGNQPLMGYNYGAKNYNRMLDVLKAGLIVVSTIELCIMFIFAITAPALIGIFTDTEEVISIGSRVLRTIMCYLPFVGAISMSRTTFQAMGKPQYAFGITIVRQLIMYIPLLLVLNSRFGFAGMLWAQPITEAVIMVGSVGMLATMLKGFSASRNMESKQSQ